jgi:PilZ domain
MEILYINCIRQPAGGVGADTFHPCIDPYNPDSVFNLKMLWEIPQRMQPDFQERRAMRRFDMRLPAVVRLVEGDSGRGDIPSSAGSMREDPQQAVPQSEAPSQFHTETQNVSARGVFFYLDHSVPAGTRCEVTLTFPPHITLTDAVRVRFAARVIRVESPLPSQRIGTAVMIEDYEFLRSGGGDFLSALQGNWKPN